jgi:hypothetical protein
MLGTFCKVSSGLRDSALSMIPVMAPCLFHGQGAVFGIPQESAP